QDLQYIGHDAHYGDHNQDLENHEAAPCRGCDCSWLPAPLLRLTGAARLSALSFAAGSMNIKALP
ncbi:hypothetical protein NSU26_24405, partial [Salmonella enterica]|nr:hypothetical protein [Salmonella enterica]